MAKFLKQYGGLVACIVLAFILPFLTEWISRNDYFAAVSWVQTHFMLYLFVMLVELILIFFFYFITSSFFAGLIVPTILTILISTVNYFKILYNDTPFSTWDLTLLSEFGDVSGSVQYTVTVSIIAALLLMSIFIGGLVFIVRKKWIVLPKIRIKRRMLGAVTMTILFVGIFQVVLFNTTVNGLLGFRYDLWSTKDFYDANGFIPSFSYGIKDMLGNRKTEPTTQGAEIVAAQDAFWEQEQATEVRPNIILILSESQSDITKFDGFTYSQDPMAYTQQLVASGTAHEAEMLSPVYGGGTANAEYDVLTSNSALDLPFGVIAYKQRVKQPMFSVAQLLKKYGYDTSSVHPFLRNFWDRDSVHPFLGIDDYYAEESFTDSNYVGNYISDNDFANKIIETFQNKKDISGNPQFIFGISMENHMDWDAAKLNEDNPIKVIDPGLLSEEERIQVEVYGQGVYDANKSLERLVNYFTETGEPTIIVQFGDHLPGLTSVYNTLDSRGDTMDLEHDLLYYTTPIVYWSNYDAIHMENQNYVASNYVAPLLIEQAKLPMPPYYQFLMDMEKEIGMPIRRTYINQEGNELLITPEGEALQDTYLYLQNYFLFQDRTFLKQNEVPAGLATKENE